MDEAAQTYPGEKLVGLEDVMNQCFIYILFVKQVKTRGLVEEVTSYTYE